jgi:hypothetical protein
MLDRVVSWVHLVGSVTSHTRFICRGSGDVTKKDAPLSRYGSRVHLVGYMQYNMLLGWCVHRVFGCLVYYRRGSITDKSMTFMW